MMLKNITKPIICLLLLLGSSYVYADEENEDTSLSIDVCRSKSIDHERLLCFDRLFNTPIYDLTINKNTVPNKINRVEPKEWYLAWEKEKKRFKNDTNGFYLTREIEDNQEAITLTYPLEETGLLVLSCVDIISRVELMLDYPINKGIINVTISGENQGEFTTRWLMDDSGFILRKGRGLPSIAVMKKIMDEENVVFTFDGYSIVISTTDLKEKIKPLRALCRW